MSSKPECVLVTGGAGFVGSHTVVELLNSGYEVVVLDNFTNASMESINKVEQITGKKVKTYTHDLMDKDGLKKIFQNHKFTLVVHLAGLKAVGESMKKPLIYYKTNIGTTVNLLETMNEFGVKDLIFSSSATVYGVPQHLPLHEENHPVGACTNAYGRTKFYIEEIIRDLQQTDNSWNAVILRYFNPVGAHESGLLGENPHGVPHNLVPYVSQVAVGRLKELKVYGNDYDTKDGTCLRDYTHVVELAAGHVAAIKRLKAKCGVATYNLGTGVESSVLDMIKAFEKVTGRKIPYKIVDRRPGDVVSMCASTTKATAEMGWTATKSLEKMCEDLWRWQSKYPGGYEDQTNGIHKA